MMTNPVDVLLIAGKHSFAGAMEHSSSRVLDVLNDVNTEFLKVGKVAVFHGLGGAAIGQFDEVTVAKAAIDCVVLMEDRHEAPQRRQFALVEKLAHSSFVLLNHYEIRGSLMFGRAVDPVLILNNGASLYFPVVHASVAGMDNPGTRLSANVVFVNKTKVSLLQIEKHVVASTPMRNSL